MTPVTSVRRGEPDAPASAAATATSALPGHAPEAIASDTGAAPSPPSPTRPGGLPAGTAPGPADAPAPDSPDRHWQIEPLWEAAAAPTGGAIRGGPLPAELRRHFDADLRIPLPQDRPAIAVNFVSTLDGVVALDRVGASGGREISGGFEPDRFVMGLLRAAADAVLVGAGTVRASGTRAWTPGRVHRPSAAAYTAWRREMGLATTTPATIVVSASGDLRPDGFDLTEPDLEVSLLSTAAGARRMRSLPRPERVKIVDLGGDDRVPVDRVLAWLRERGYRLVLSEGGPTLFGELLAADAIDDLFLTVAPQVAGRSDRAQRLSLVEGMSFAPPVAPWARLRSVMRSEDYLFLRYDLGGERTEGAS